LDLRHGEKIESRKTLKLIVSIVGVALTLTVIVFAQRSPSPHSSPEQGRGGAETRSAVIGEDLLWKKLDNRVGDMVEKFDGEMGVAIVDLTDGIRNRKLAAVRKVKRSWTTFTYSIQKIWSKTAKSWLVLLRA
jgi:hypothetical protein